MKSIPALLFALAALVASARASSPELAQIVRERDATLSRLVTLQESRFQSGLGDHQALFVARTALATFRRDVATTPAEKIAQQKLIVGWLEERLTNVKTRFTTGTGNEEELLRATDELLAAKQTLLELSEAPKR